MTEDKVPDIRADCGVTSNLTGKEPMDEKRLPVILGVAKQTRRRLLGMLPIYAAATLLSLSNSFVGPLPVVAIVDRLVVLLFIGLAAYSLVSYRRIGRFIDAHDAMDQRAHRSQAAGEQ